MVQFLVFVLLVLLIFILVLLGVIMLRRATWWMTKAVAWITIAVAVVMALSFVIGGLATGRLLFGLVYLQLLYGIALAAIVFWVAVLADCALNETPKNDERLIWVLIIVFAPILGACIYYFARRPRRISGADRVA